MKLFDLIKVWEPTFEAQKAKVHLARYNGNERPLDVFLEGQFDEWQRWQSKRNFQREFVVSLISAGSPTRWLYAGLFRSLDHVEEGDPKPHYYYTLERVSSCEEWVGRLVLRQVDYYKSSLRQQQFSLGFRPRRVLQDGAPVLGTRLRGKRRRRYTASLDAIDEDFVG